MKNQEIDKVRISKNRGNFLYTENNFYTLEWILNSIQIVDFIIRVNKRKIMKIYNLYNTSEIKFIGNYLGARINK